MPWTGVQQSVDYILPAFLFNLLPCVFMLFQSLPFHRLLPHFVELLLSCAVLCCPVLTSGRLAADPRIL